MSIKSRLLVALLLIAGGGVAYYVRVYLPRHRALGELAYVLPGSLTMVDTPAEVRQVVANLKSGDRVEVLTRTRSWMRVRAPGGRTGWVESKDMLDAETYGRGQRLLKGLSSLPPQARAHCGRRFSSSDLTPGDEAWTCDLLPSSSRHRSGSPAHRNNCRGRLRGNGGGRRREEGSGQNEGEDADAETHGGETQAGGNEHGSRLPCAAAWDHAGGKAGGGRW